MLFIDEIHRLQPAIEEYLYPAMEDYKLDILIDQGPNARSVRLNLPKFTLIGATTRAGMISSPLRSRFGMNCRLDYYTAEELQKIIVRSAGLIGIAIDDAGALEIAARARGAELRARSCSAPPSPEEKVRGPSTPFPPAFARRELRSG